MQTIRTIRCKIDILPDDLSTVVDLFEAYSKACTEIAAYGRQNHEGNAFRLQKALYRSIRSKHKLSANLVVTAIRRAAGALKTANFKGRFEFRSTFVGLDARTFTLKLAKGIVSFSTHTGKRITVALDIGAYQHEALWGADVAQSATLVRANDGFYANIVVENKVPDAIPGGTLGVDLGIRNIAATSHGYKKPGKDLREYQEDRWRIRASLQSKGTKGAKRALKRLSGRERRHATWVNHNVAKEIVANAIKNGCPLIRLENLKGIRARTKIPNRHRNRMTALWSFGQLQAFVTYKAARHGISVEKIDPAYSSKTCHKCLKLGIRNRETFVCTPCGLTLDADDNAALMIATGGAAVTRPKSNGRDHKSP